ncbi:LOW QUALITY PROTEIN: calcium-binding mitochondrial carrier protein SCaMC-1-like [Vombatus ursinus]|uniref:LOW QUALITY PROTEIN: calcium-binding mitochondrial carrier protein SCaMC-1-like n=1 Tax=Vombatus ursinus TaxID=29139 RepID=UPI000FFD080B|nr:LOW QUALITY PROTEIN: calcium-binding mitochondrial carrier protein SCaMC-1-like [Vombatus ursinus]
MEKGECKKLSYGPKVKEPQVIVSPPPPPPPPRPRERRASFLPCAQQCFTKMLAPRGAPSLSPPPPRSDRDPRSEQPPPSVLGQVQRLLAAGGFPHVLGTPQHRLWARCSAGCVASCCPPAAIKKTESPTCVMKTSSGSWTATGPGRWTLSSGRRPPAPQHHAQLRRQGGGAGKEGGGASRDGALKTGDTEKDVKPVFDEFKKYIKNHGKKLKLTFKSLDKSDSRKIEPLDIVQAFKTLGTNVSKLQATYILQSLDDESTMSVDWNEWMNYFAFNTIGYYEEIIQFWKHSTVIDIGESLSVPDEFTENDGVCGQRWRQVVAGMTAGAISRMSTAPLEHLMQAQALLTVTITLKTGFETMLREGGVYSLWKGNSTNVLKIAPETSIKYWSYEKYKNLLATERTTIGITERFISGSLAGIIAQTLVYPLEVLKTRLALDSTSRYTRISNCVQKMLKYEGYKTFYKGYVPNIIPYAGVDLAVFELLKNFWLQHHSRDSVNPGIVVVLAYSTLSDPCGQLASYPFTPVRTCMQAEETLGGIPPMKMISLIKIIILTDGVIGFYKGIIPNIVKVLPAVCISYVICEKTKTGLGVAEV